MLPSITHLTMVLTHSVSALVFSAGWTIIQIKHTLHLIIIKLLMYLLQYSFNDFLIYEIASVVFFLKFMTVFFYAF